MRCSPCIFLSHTHEVSCYFCCSPGLAHGAWWCQSPAQLYSLRNDPKVHGNHLIVHRRSDTVSFLHISPQVSFYLHGLCYPVGLPWFNSLIVHLHLNSNLTFDWLAPAVLNPCFPCFPFLSYFNNHLIHFIIPSPIPSNLYFILWLIFLKFEFQSTISRSQYFCDFMCLWEANACLCASQSPRALAPGLEPRFLFHTDVDASQAHCNSHHAPCSCTCSYLFLEGRAPSCLHGNALLILKTLFQHYFLHEVIPAITRWCELLSSTYVSYTDFAFLCITQDNFICL